MITCTVCGTENDDLSIVCSSCKGFLQGRVDALNLFSTVWGLIESPRATFKRIVLAKHKNYALILSVLFGVSLVFEIAWYKSLARVIPDLFTLLAAAVILGPLVGLIVVYFFALTMRLVGRMFGGRATGRNMFAAVAYATVPLLFSLVFLVPIEIAIFGADFFGTNPPPMIIKPVEYTVLLGLKAVLALFMMYLLIEAVAVAHGIGREKFGLVTGSVVAALVACVLAVHFVGV